MKPTPPPDWDLDVIDHAVTTIRPADYRPAGTWHMGMCTCGHAIHGATCWVLDPVTDEACGCIAKPPDGKGH